MIDAQPADARCIAAAVDAATKAAIADIEARTGGPSHVVVDDSVLVALAGGGYGETIRIEDGRHGHLIDADPAAILASHTFGDAVDRLLRAARDIGRAVHVFPASRSICIATS